MRIDGTVNNDTLTGTAEDDTITGWYGDDRLDGAAGDDVLDGGHGVDVLYGGTSGFDTLRGGSHNDRLIGGTGGDHLFGDWGDDLFEPHPDGGRIDGGEGFDTVSFQHFAAGVEIHLGGAAQLHQITAVEGVIGSELGDGLYGNADANALRGLGGQDVLIGDEGNDSLDGGAGADTVEGGPGDDRVVYDAADVHIDGGAGSDTLALASAATVDLGGVADQVAGGGTTTGFEHVDAAQSTFAVSLTGSATANHLDSGAADDLLDGRGGVDTLHGGHGNDTLAGGDGDDRISGGLGQDTAVFSGTFADYTLTNVSAGISVQDTRVAGDGTDILNSVERLQFSDRTVDLSTLGRLTAEERARLFAEGAEAVTQLDGITYYRNGKAVLAAEEIEFNQLPDPQAWLVYPLQSGQYVGLSQSSSGPAFKVDVLTAQLLDTDGQPIGEPIQVNQIADRVLIHARVVPLEGARFSVVFSDGDEVGQTAKLYQRMFEGQAALTPTENLIRARFEIVELDAAPSADGDFLLAQSWNAALDFSGTYIDGLRLGPDGALRQDYAVADRIPHETDPRTDLEHTSPAIASLGGGAVVAYVESRYVWDESGNLSDEAHALKAQVFGADGTKQGEAVTVAPMGGDGFTGFDVDVASLSDGRFIVVWDAEASVQGRLHGPDGMPFGPAFEVGTSPGRSGDPTVVALPDGGFLVRWISTKGFVAQRFDRDGEALGDSVGVGDGPMLVRSNGDLMIVHNGGARVYAALDYTVLTPDADTVPGAATDGLIVTTPADLNAGDLINGGDGDDTLELSASGVLDLTAPAAFSGIEILLGASGNDTFIVSDARLAEVTRIDGRGGFDVITTTGTTLDLSGIALAGIERVNGTSGNDLITGSAGSDTIFGLLGDDTLAGGAGNDALDGSRGNDIVQGGAGDDTVLGGLGDDTLSGDPGHDRLDGGDGSDTASYAETSLGVTVRLATGTATGVASEVGADMLVGIEHVEGGSGGDALTGDSEANRLAGRAGDDTLEGGKNHDTLQGGDGSDTLLGALDDDRLEGGTGIDLLRGDSGNDTLLGGEHNDRMVGGAGNDLLDGGSGADELRGESGRDVLQGGAAGDRLYGGYGADVLAGGEGADRFFLTALGESGTSAATRDVITDFEVGADVINLARINAVQGGGGNAAFSFIGEDAFTAAGQLRFVQDATANRTIVEGNVNADLAADFRIELIGLHNLAAGDFML